MPVRSNKKSERNLLRPTEVLEEFPELSKRNFIPADFGRLLNLGILKGKRSKQLRGKGGYDSILLIERYSVIRLIQLINDYTMGEIIHFKPEPYRVVI